MQIKANKILYFLFLLLFNLSCSKEEKQLNNEDLVFSDSYRIEIKPYSYKDQFDNTYFVKGDTIYYSFQPDTLNNAPLFKWDSSGYSLQVVAVFNSPIEIAGNQIVNIDDIVWQWHSGMKFDKKRSIKYSEGKNVLNGIINYNDEPKPLNPGNYYWAIWGWSSDATRILFSSREMWFYVKE